MLCLSVVAGAVSVGKEMSRDRRGIAWVVGVRHYTKIKPCRANKRISQTQDTSGAVEEDG